MACLFDIVAVVCFFASGAGLQIATVGGFLAKRRDQAKARGDKYEPPLKKTKKLMHWQCIWDKSIAYGDTLAETSDKSYGEMAVSLGGRAMPVFKERDSILPIAAAIRRIVLRRRGQVFLSLVPLSLYVIFHSN